MTLHEIVEATRNARAVESRRRALFWAMAQIPEGGDLAPVRYILAQLIGPDTAERVEPALAEKIRRACRAVSEAFIEIAPGQFQGDPERFAGLGVIPRFLPNLIGFNLESGRWVLRAVQPADLPEGAFPLGQIVEDGVATALAGNYLTKCAACRRFFVAERSDSQACSGTCRSTLSRKRAKREAEQ
jgi:hypothetical protein